MRALTIVRSCLVCLLVVVGSDAHADTAAYSLVDVILDDGTQMTGTFTWTYDPGDFQGGSGQFTELNIPWTLHDQNDLDIVFDLGNSVEFTLVGNFHDDGVDITLFLAEPLTATTSASLDLSRSAYDIGGNGFHAGGFLDGSIVPDGPTGIEPQPDLGVRLYASAPNPFRFRASIRYDLPRPMDVVLRVFDVAGRLVRVLESSPQGTGPHETFWDGTDAAGRPTAAGLYFYRLEAGTFRDTGRLVWMK